MVGTIKNKAGNIFDVEIKQDGKSISFLIKNGGSEIGHLVVSKEEKRDDHLSIKDAYVDLNFRKQDLWKNVMYFARDFVKKLGYKGLLSFGQFRRPASDHSWLGLPDRMEMRNPASRKTDYFLENLDTFSEFCGRDI